MNRRRFCLQKGGSQEHISFITIKVLFNEFAFTIQVKHKINSMQIVGFYFDMFVFYDWPCVLCKNVAYFPFYSWLSFQRLCPLLWGYHFHFVDSIMLQIIL